MVRMHVIEFRGRIHVGNDGKRQGRGADRLFALTVRSAAGRHPDIFPDRVAETVGLRDHVAFQVVDIMHRSRRRGVGQGAGHQLRSVIVGIRALQRRADRDRLQMAAAVAL